MSTSGGALQEQKLHPRDLSASKQGRQPGKKQKKNARPGDQDADSNEAVLLADVRSLLASSKLQDHDGSADSSSPSHASSIPLNRFSTVEVGIERLSSLGDGLGFSSTSDHVFIVPFTVPGDVVEARIVDSKRQEKYSITDFMRVIRPSGQRDDTLVKCKYFSSCSGCQFQMLSYDDQLAHKKSVIERAYKNFSKLAPEIIPRIGEVIGSPLQYGYRTKLTPHFQGPGGPRKAKPSFKEAPPIGFQMKGRRKTMDIESCPIGTPILNLGMTRERLRVVERLHKYRKGATILLRESTKRVASEHSEVETSLSMSPSLSEVTKTPDEQLTNPQSTTALPAAPPAAPPSVIAQRFPEHMEIKSCISDNNDLCTEFVDHFEFKNTAGAFFQNNNAILPRFTAYIRDHILPPGSAGSVKYLIDAYCGSGLFTVCLSSLFSSSIGIDIAASAITAARDNAATNKISNASFMAADASTLFSSVSFPADETAVVIDPPRKGCDESFLNQLLQLGPRRVVYVSCNVHTQARDVGILVEGRGGARYNIESLVGFDFFPQTSHVEGVAVLDRVERPMIPASNAEGPNASAIDS